MVPLLSVMGLENSDMKHVLYATQNNKNKKEYLSPHVLFNLLETSLKVIYELLGIP